MGSLYLLPLHICFDRSVVAYKTTVMPIHSMTSIGDGGKLSLYDSVDEDVLRCYREFSLANLIFYAMKESACSEQSQRMTAMDGATKNAGPSVVHFLFNVR